MRNCPCFRRKKTMDTFCMTKSSYCDHCTISSDDNQAKWYHTLHFLDSYMNVGNIFLFKLKHINHSIQFALMFSELLNAANKFLTVCYYSAFHCIYNSFVAFSGDSVHYMHQVMFKLLLLPVRSYILV